MSTYPPPDYNNYYPQYMPPQNPIYDSMTGTYIYPQQQIPPTYQYPNNYNLYYQQNQPF